MKLCPSPDGGQETYILCRSRDRREKEKAMHERFEQRIDEALEKVAGKLPEAEVEEGRHRSPDRPDHGQEQPGGRTVRGRGEADRRPRRRLVDERTRRGATGPTLNEGCYLLRTNVTDWSAEDLWQAYIQLTEAEAAFRIHKSDLRIRPVWHQKEDRVLAHILVCFLAYVSVEDAASDDQGGRPGRRAASDLRGTWRRSAWSTWCSPPAKGPEIRRRCVRRPTDHQAILLDRLGSDLASANQKLKPKCSEDF